MATPANQQPARDTLTAMQQELFHAHHMLADFLHHMVEVAPPVIVSQEPVRHPAQPKEETDVYETLQASPLISTEELQARATHFAGQLVEKFKALDQLASQLPDVEPHAVVDRRVEGMMVQHLELKRQLKEEQELTEAALEQVQDAHAAIVDCSLESRHA